MNSKNLKKMISEIVRIEMAKILPGMLEEAFSRTIDRIVLEEKVARKRKDAAVSLKEKLSYDDDDDEDDEQELYENKRETRRKRDSKLFDESNPLSFVYEGVTPTSEVSVTDVPDGGGIDIDALDEALDIDFSKMKNLVSSMEARAASNRPIRHHVMNENLDRKVGEDKEVENRTVRMYEQPVSSKHPAIEGDVFPSAPVGFDIIHDD